MMNHWFGEVRRADIIKPSVNAFVTKCIESAVFAMYPILKNKFTVTILKCHSYRYLPFQSITFAN